MIEAVIVDDERLARKDLRAVLQQFPFITITGEASNVAEALQLIERTLPQLIFLDIEMPEANGFTLLEQLKTVPEVIFTTAYDAYAIKAFEVNALDYLLKPVTSKRLAESLERLQEVTKPAVQQTAQYPELREKIFVKDGERCWFIPLGDIRLLESTGSYTRICFGKHAPLLARSLQAMESRLNPQYFFRASRKHIVNLEHVQHIIALNQYMLQLELTDGTKIPVSRRQSILFRELRGI
ncbi:LytTR family DNA-binding domain-containing protein [Chitinophaga niabensis]|uniref:LytR/AlgR family response regulator transcription factor n=1 Tax=Chitinophaga niabensis TaxID=536979 RepID=UPI0031BB6712